MKESVQKLLDEISKIRKESYCAEVERQKEEIENGLVAFLKEQKESYEELERATIAQQNPVEMKFTISLETEILPEVEEYIEEQLGLKVDYIDRSKAGGIFLV